jgi:hypothetical protein
MGSIKKDKGRVTFNKLAIDARHKRKQAMS